MGRCEGGQAEMSCRNGDEEEVADRHIKKDLKGLSKLISICKNQYQTPQTLLFQSKHTSSVHIH